jgi:Tol biopolymer transport system component
VNTQYRHPSWSPDHTKIVWAQGPNGGPWDLFVRDLTQPVSATNPKNITSTATSEDRPAWSPDGTRIAYQGDQGANLDVKVRNADGSNLTTVATNVETGMGAGAFYPRPHWTPDSKFIFYSKMIDATQKHDIYKSPANGSNTTGTPVITGTTDDLQPEVSPDGGSICFTRVVANKDVWRASLSGALPTAVADTGGDDFECAWSPDQSKIAFVEGAQNAGMILMRNSNGTGSIDTVTDVANKFDGNPDWAINFRPVCQRRTVNVPGNGSVTIPLGCTDRDISNPSAIFRQIVARPGRGKLGAIDHNRNTVSYTPGKDFKGNDAFTFKGSDGNSASSPAKITLKDATAAEIDKVRMSHKTWRRGKSLPVVLSRAPVGTIISYRLSEKARVTLTFSLRSRGRKVGRRCVKPRRSNRTKRRCTRFVKAGTLKFNGKQGTNRVKFQGRLSRRKRLALGRYRLTVGATDAAGNVSKRSRPVAFRIVKR